MTTNIVIVGVGGQGTLLASRILGHIAMGNGYDARVSEVHGMSQRGGSVTTYVRMSAAERLYSTIVEQEQADFILAFETLEALRALPYLKKDGLMIVNTQQILPMPVITGAAEYPGGCACPRACRGGYCGARCGWHRRKMRNVPRGKRCAVGGACKADAVPGRTVAGSHPGACETPVRATQP